MKEKNVKVGLKVVIKDDFVTYAKAGDVCVIHNVESDGAHKLYNTRTQEHFYRNAFAYSKLKEQ